MLEVRTQDGEPEDIELGNADTAYHHREVEAEYDEIVAWLAAQAVPR